MQEIRTAVTPECNVAKVEGIMSEDKKKRKNLEGVGGKTGSESIFKHDGHHPEAACLLVKNYRQKTKVKVVKSPAQSPGFQLNTCGVTFRKISMAENHQI